MKKKALKILAFVIGVLMIVGMLAACSGSSDSASYDSGNSSEKYLGDSDAYYYEDYGNAASGSSSSGSSGGSSGSSSGSRTAENLTDSNRKIIESYTYSLETKTYNSFVAELETQIKSLGGYIESLDSHNSSSSGYISCSYSIKIPTEKKEELKSFIEENANVLSSSIDTQDVTLSYIDVESRLKSLRLEQESLETLLENAQSVSDIITVQERLSEVIYEIESYESQLRSMDNDIDYTSFYLSVREVEHESVKVEDTVWQRIGANLSKNFAAVGEFFEDLFVGFVSLLPLWIILGVMGLIALLIVKLSIKGARKRRAKREQDMKEHPEKYQKKSPAYPQTQPVSRPYPQQPVQRPVQPPVQNPSAQPAQQPVQQTPPPPAEERKTETPQEKK